MFENFENTIAIDKASLPQMNWPLKLKTLELSIRRSGPLTN